MPAHSLRATAASLAFLCALPALAAPKLPERAATVVAYDISVQLDPEKKELNGREHIVWRNPSTDPADAVSDLWFHLYWNAFRNNRSTFFVESGGQLRRDKAETDGWGWTEITAVKLATGENLLPSLTFEQPDDDNADDRTVARVLLPTPVPPGGEIALDIEFQTKVPKVFARAGYKGDFFAVTQWFPKLGVYEPAGLRGREQSGWNCHQYHANSEYYADYGRFKVEITVPKRFVVGATGPETARRENADGTTTYVHQQADVHDFAWTADPRFLEYRETFSADRDVTPQEYAATAKLLDRSLEEVKLQDVAIRLLLQPGHEPQKDRHFAAAKLALKWYGLWYGAYPYETLTLVDPTPGAGGAAGVEYPTLFFCGTNYLYNFWPGKGLLHEAEIVTVHEFGHQFWYGLVGSNEFEEAWLDEGFTTYSTAKVLEIGYGRDNSIVDFLGLELGAVESDRMQNSLESRRYDKIATSAWQFSRNQYGYNAYARPALMLETLEGMLGTETMARVMRTYHERFRFGHPRGADFFAVAEEVSGQQLDSFFAQTVDSPGVLDPAILDLTSEPAPQARGKVMVDGAEVEIDEKRAAELEGEADDSESRNYRSILQLRQRGEMILPVEVELLFEGKEPERRLWDDGQRWAKWEFERPEKLLEVRLDPDGKLALDADRLNNTRRIEPDPAAARKLATGFLFWLQQGMALLGM
ncbi:MAG: M1 family metallopeptidase [Thermoanaerobaculia bacterium]